MLKSAIVTGSSKGIGKAIAKQLAKDGFAVAINYTSSGKEAEAALDEIKSAGGEGILVQGNVAKKETAKKLFDEMTTAFGGVDVLVNNAGVIDLKTIDQIDEETYRRTISVNIDGTFFAMQEAADRLRDKGKIINFSSTVTRMMMPRYSLYTASKMAVNAMTKIVAKELGERGITVNAVAPGPVDTELFWRDKTEEQVNKMMEMIPLGRLGEPQDIANVVSFLCSDKGGWVNGEIIYANGGIA